MSMAAKDAHRELITARRCLAAAKAGSQDHRTLVGIEAALRRVVRAEARRTCEGNSECARARRALVYFGAAGVTIKTASHHIGVSAYRTGQVLKSLTDRGQAERLHRGHYRAAGMLTELWGQPS